MTTEAITKIPGAMKLVTKTETGDHARRLRRDANPTGDLPRGPKPVTDRCCEGKRGGEEIRLGPCRGWETENKEESRWAFPVVTQVFNKGEKRDEEWGG